MALNENIPYAPYGTGDAVGQGSQPAGNATGTPRPIPTGMGVLAVTSVGPVRRFEKVTPRPPEPIVKASPRKLGGGFGARLLARQSAPSTAAPPRIVNQNFAQPAPFKGVVTNIEPREKALDAPPFPLMRATIGVALIAIGFKEGGPWLLLALAGAALDVSAFHKWKNAGGKVS